jgi:hypothetical protein
MPTDTEVLEIAKRILVVLLGIIASLGFVLMFSFMFCLIVHAMMAILGAETLGSFRGFEINPFRFSLSDKYFQLAILQIIKFNHDDTAARYPWTLFGIQLKNVSERPMFEKHFLVCGLEIHKEYNETWQNLRRWGIRYHGFTRVPEQPSE